MAKHTVQAELGGMGTTGTDKDLETSPFPENYLVCLQRVVVRNHNKNDCIADVGVKIGGSIMWLESVVMTDENHYAVMIGETFFESCKSVIVRFCGSRTTDKISAYVYGYYLD